MWCLPCYICLYGLLYWLPEGELNWLQIIQPTKTAGASKYQTIVLDYVKDINSDTKIQGTMHQVQQSCDSYDLNISIKETKRVFNQSSENLRLN